MYNLQLTGLRRLVLQNNDSPATLESCLQDCGIEMSAENKIRLGQYCGLLWEWNGKLNLTRHTTFEKFVTRDVVDTLALANLIEQGESVMDIGSGGGVPGLSLALVRPDLKVVLTEPMGKKARVLQDMVQRLGIQVEVCNQRAEEVVAKRRFDVVTARAVGPLWQILRWFQHNWDHIGRLLVIKGPRWVEERGEARHRGLLKPLELRVAANYPMPATESESVILKLWSKDPATTES